MLFSEFCRWCSLVLFHFDSGCLGGLIMFCFTGLWVGFEELVFFSALVCGWFARLVYAPK